MKKFFALLCTMAMVMSLFSGVVLAADPIQLKATLDKSSVITYANPDDDDAVEITGKVTAAGKSPSGVVYYGLFLDSEFAVDDSSTDDDERLEDVADKVDVDYIKENAIAYSLGSAGKIDLSVPAEDLPIGKYVLVFASSDAKYLAGYVNLTATYNVTVDQDLSNVKYLDTVDIISGRITDATGKGVSNLDVYMKFGGTEPAEYTTNKQGAFALALGDIKVGGSSALMLQTNLEDKTEFTLKSFAVKSIAWKKIENTVSSAKVKVAPTVLTATLTKPTDSDFKATDEVNVKVSGVRFLVDGEEETEYTFKDVKVKANGSKFDLEAPEVTFLQTGTATVEINWGNKVVSTYTISVGSAGKVNVLGLAKEYNVGTVDEIALDVLDNAGEPVANVDVKVTAPGVELTYKWDNDEDDNDDEIAFEDGVLTISDVTFPEAGTLTIEVTGYNSNDKKLDTVSVTAAIKGLKVVASTDTATVDTEVTFTVTVTKEDGTPVNNANVYLLDPDTEYDEEPSTSDAVEYVLSSKTNISNGVYTFEDVTFDEVTGDKGLTLVVYQGGSLKAVFVDFFTVKGENIFTLEADKTSVLAGEENTINVTVVDKDGDIVAVDEIVVLDKDGKVVKDAKATWTSSKNSYKVTVPATTNAFFTIEARNDNAKEIGSLKIEVVKPVLQINKSVLTDGVEQTVEVQLVNPLTNEALKGEVKINVNEGLVAYEEKDDKVTAWGLKVDDEAVDPAAGYVTGKVGTEFTFEIITNSKSASDLEKDEEVPSVNFYVKVEDTWVKCATLNVAPATLAADKDSVTIDSENAIVLTLTDAEGKPLVGKKVYAGNVQIGKTDDNGQVSYTVYPAGSATYTFTYTNDADKDIEVELKAVRDTVAPVITLDSVPATTKAEVIVVKGVVTDNVAATRVFVNNKEVVAFPGENGLEFETEVALNIGENTIRVVAMDAANNRGTAQATVVRERPVVVKMVLGTTDVTKDNQALTGLDVPAQSIGGRTMLPLRFAFETILGGTVDYADGVITVYYNGHTAVMTVGSTTALVDGEAITLLSAPVIQNGRALAPIREVLAAFGVTVDFDSATQTVILTY